MGQRIEKYFWDEKELLLEKENKSQKQNKRLSLYHQILTNAPNYFLLDKKEDFIAKNLIIFENTKDSILEELWQ